MLDDAPGLVLADVPVVPVGVVGSVLEPMVPVVSLVVPFVDAPLDVLVSVELDVPFACVPLDEPRLERPLARWLERGAVLCGSVEELCAPLPPLIVPVDEPVEDPVVLPMLPVLPATWASVAAGIIIAPAANIRVKRMVDLLHA